jgi:hypothetical protein
MYAIMAHFGIPNKLIRLNESNYGKLNLLRKDMNSYDRWL